MLQLWPNGLAGEFVDRFRQRIGFVRFAVRCDFCSIFLQAIEVQDVIVSVRIVVAAHPGAHEFPILLIVSEPIPASDLVHI